MNSKITKILLVAIALIMAGKEQEIPFVDKTDFADDSTIPENIKSYAQYAYDKGIIDGYDNGDGSVNFESSMAVTRAQAAVMVSKILSLDKAEAKGNIKFDNVDFSYVPERPLIENFNLNVREGEHIAIVGPTGAGKSTLASAITGPLATCVFGLKMYGAAINSGMGTCGLLGPIGIILGWFGGEYPAAVTWFDWLGLALICFILPAVLSLIFAAILRKMGWIKENDLKLDL
mgnify:CR=1 FL=1